MSKKSKWLWIIVFAAILAFFTLGFVSLEALNGTKTLILAASFAVMVALFAWQVLVLKDTQNLHKYAFVAILLVGMISAFAQPVLNIPDESSHYARSEAVSRGQIIVPHELDDRYTVQATKDLFAAMTKPYEKTELKGKPFDATPVAQTAMAVSNPSFIYIPQALGLLAAKILGLPVIWSLWLGRLFNLLCYAFLTALGIRLAPCVKYPLFFIAMQPMCIQQAASMSPDAVINGLAVLLIGYFLYLYCGEKLGNPVMTGTKQIVIFLFISLLVAVSKVTNVFLAGLILLIPAERFKNAKQSLAARALVIIAAVAAAFLWWRYTTTIPTIMDLEGVDSAAQIQYILANPMTWLHNFVRAMINSPFANFTTLNYYGWMNFLIQALIVPQIIFLTKVYTQEKGPVIPAFKKFLVCLMAGGMYATVHLAMYLASTAVGSEHIEGVQGRYFIPMLLLLTVLFLPSRRSVADAARQEGYREKMDLHYLDSAALYLMLGLYLASIAIYFY